MLAGQNELSVHFNIFKISFLVAINVLVIIIFNKFENNGTVLASSPCKTGGVTERQLQFQRLACKAHLRLFLSTYISQLSNSGYTESHKF